MTKENLIPIRTHERAVELGRKGGQAKSPRKTIASIKNGLKNAAEKTKDKWLTKLITSPQANALFMMNLAIDISRLDLNADQKIKLLHALAAVHRAIHPTSINVQGNMGGTFIVKWADTERPSSSLSSEQSENHGDNNDSNRSSPSVGSKTNDSCDK
jgi:hypothetical protein